MKLLAAAAMLLLLVAGTAGAEAPQSLQDLQAAAVKAVQQAAPADVRVVAEAENLDSRLRLPACGGDLQAQAPDLRHGAARVSVPVACTAGRNWNVRVQVRVQMFRNVLVSSHDLARGDVVGAGDVHTEERDIARLGYGYMADATQLVGRHLRRALAAGTVVTPGMLAARVVVQRGQQVSLVAKLDNILVRASGVALEAGDRGDLIRVKSLSCDCVVQGKVRDPGIVDTLP